MPRVSFGKYQGLGNDFVVMEDVFVTPAAAMRLCHRRRGIGADGVLTLLPSTRADTRMHVYNADGSEAEMCGNGLRCVIRRLGRPAVIETGAGLLRGSLEEAGIRVQLGRARVLGGVDVELDGERLIATAVSMGNPHLVLPPFSEETDLFALAARHGPRLERHPRFPERTNVELVKPRGDGLDLVVFERGSGITDACGTGAAATAFALAASGVSIRLPGGTLQVFVDGDAVEILGPAEHVFDGEIELEDSEIAG